MVLYKGEEISFFVEMLFHQSKIKNCSFVSFYFDISACFPFPIFELKINCTLHGLLLYLYITLICQSYDQANHSAIVFREFHDWNFRE